MADNEIAVFRRTDTVHTGPKSDFPGLLCAWIDQDTMNHAMLVQPMTTVLRRHAGFVYENGVTTA
jgi:hypothetical protein